MEDDLLKSLIGSIDNEYAALAEEGTYADVDQFIDTGSYTLNALFSGSINGGFPSNKISALCGLEGTGKTYLMLSIVKFFLDRNKDSIVVIFETEGAITKDLLSSRQIDTKRILMVPVETIQQFKSQCLRLVEGYIEQKTKNKKDSQRKMMICLDSLGMLSTTKEVADTGSGSDKKDMTRQSEIRSAFRVLTLKLSKAGVPMLATNHVYDNVGNPYGPKHTISGGKGVLYASSNILMLTKSKEREGDDVVGTKIKVVTYKSRFTREGSSVDVLLHFDKGLDRHYGLTEIALEAGIFNKISTKIQLPDGTSVFEKHIKANPEKYFTAEVLEKIEKYVKKTLLYGAGDDDVLVEGILNDE